MTAIRLPNTSHSDLLALVSQELLAQEKKWGPQDYPDGTGPQNTWAYRGRAQDVREQSWRETDVHSDLGSVTFRHILAEEMFETFAETDPEKLSTELVHVAAVALQWAAAIGRRAAKDGTRV
ncbi:hypothetical protein [Arthrobacter sp. NPDC090010]|uniref:hypothetical protein n=1 Tax=Arthrobacter sp. NPDC090010 TaxID=3363942 RepID=UPI0037FE5DD2